MYEITPQQIKINAGNNVESAAPFSKFYHSNRYFWLNNTYLAENAMREKKQKLSAAGFLMGAGVLLIFSKAVHKYSKKILDIFRGYFEKNANQSFLNKPNLKTKFYSYLLKKTDIVAEKSESLNNIISLKDILFTRFMYKTKPTKIIHKSISDFFENISRNTVSKSYKNTQKHFDKMYEQFDKFDEYLLKNDAGKTINYIGKDYTLPELIAQAKNYRESVKLVVNAFISKDTQQARFKYIKDSTSALYSKFWDESFKGFWTKDNKFKHKEMWQKFIASEQIQANKTDLAYNASFARNMLSYTPAEKLNYVNEYLKNLRSIIKAEDEKATELLNKMEWYVKDSTALSENKENFLSELNKFEQHNIVADINQSIRDVQKDKSTNIQLIRNITNDNGTGELEDMISIYRKIAPFELSKSGTLEIAQKSVESFDKSVKLETSILFDKLRDLDIGSAPTDVLTLIFSSLMISLGLNQAKNSDERKSVILKSGIPIIGAVATTTISATKLLPNGKSIMLGFISGIILNRIGVITDNIRKDLEANKNNKRV